MEMAWSEVQTELAVARRVRLQQQIRKMSQEPQHKLAQRKAMRDLYGVVVQVWPNFTLMVWLHVCSLLQ